jgi:hypothetical protein
VESERHPHRKFFDSHISSLGENLFVEFVYSRNVVYSLIPFHLNRFFGAYHAARKVLQITVPQNRETNMITAAAVCITPLIAIGSLRPLVPYSVMLVAIDAFNELSGP